MSVKKGHLELGNVVLLRGGDLEPLMHEMNQLAGGVIWE
jgi:hypothetical protein